jgi:hypothetical protein
MTTDLLPVSRNRHEHLQPEQMTTDLLPVSRNRHMHLQPKQMTTGLLSGVEESTHAPAGRVGDDRPSSSVEKSTRALSDRVGDDRPSSGVEESTLALAQGRTSAAGETSISDQCREIDTCTCSPSR